jgi:hypothetical protein
VAADRLVKDLARASEFLRELDEYPELKSTPSAARVRWALATAGELLQRVHEHRRDARSDVQKRVDEAEKAMRLAEKAIERARELVCLVRKAREERKRLLDDLALRLARAKVERLRTTEA